MKVEINKFPESQEIMNEEDWFLIQSQPYDILGSSAYGRIIENGIDDVIDYIMTESNIDKLNRLREIIDIREKDINIKSRHIPRFINNKQGR